MRMRLLFILPFLLIIVIPAFGDEALIGISSNDAPNLKSVSVVGITDGLEVRSVVLDLNTDTQTSTSCQLKAMDESLNRVTISAKFQCDQKASIPLNEVGRDIIESKTLTDETFQILLVTDKINDPVKSLSINSIDITYDTPVNYAKIENGRVSEILVATQQYIDQQAGTWVKAEGNKVASVGDQYSNGLFIGPKPYTTWELDSSGIWQAPIKYPNDGRMYVWNDGEISWVPV